METTTAETPVKEKSRFIKDFNPIEQWDQVAATLIYKELAPKGFKKYQSGHWKGAEHADIPFLSKNQVGQCQKIASQLVRTFRDQVTFKGKKQLETVNQEVTQLDAQYALCNFWEFKRKRNLRERLIRKIATAEIINDLLIELNNTKVPQK